MQYRGIYLIGDYSLRRATLLLGLFEFVVHDMGHVEEGGDTLFDLRLR